jgi:lysozyme
MKTLVILFMLSVSNFVAVDSTVEEDLAVEISNTGLDLIKQFEGFRSSPYLDTGNTPSIGFGTILYPDGKPVTMEDPPITESQALEYLQYNVNQKCDSINKIVTTSLNQNQFDALCSFAYNLGINALRNSTLLKLVNQGDFKAASQQFLSWDHSGGIVIPGLERRRIAEQQLFTQGDQDANAVTDVASN